MPSITHKELAVLSPGERDRLLDQIESEMLSPSKRGAQSSAYVMLRGFESRFGMSTDEMLARVAEGSLAEDDDIAVWLFWADAANQDRGVR